MGRRRGGGGEGSFFDFCLLPCLVLVIFFIFIVCLVTLFCIVLYFVFLAVCVCCLSEVRGGVGGPGGGGGGGGGEWAGKGSNVLRNAFCQMHRICIHRSAHV